MMEKLYIDKKLTVWQRYIFDIKSEEDTKEIVNIVKSTEDVPISDERFKDMDILWDTAEYVPIENNNYNSTLEVLLPNGKKLYKNNKK